MCRCEETLRLQRETKRRSEESKWDNSTERACSVVGLLGGERAGVNWGIGDWRVQQTLGGLRPSVDGKAKSRRHDRSWISSIWTVVRRVRVSQVWQRLAGNV